MSNRLQKKYPISFERARRLDSEELQRGISFYIKGGGFTHEDWEDIKGKR